LPNADTGWSATAGHSGSSIGRAGNDAGYGAGYAAGYDMSRVFSTGRFDFVGVEPAP